AVIIEMIAGQIGESRRRHHDTVEAELRQAVARRLDRGMLDALRRQFGEVAVQGYRVRGGQRTGPPLGRRYQAERPETGGRMAEIGPDLAREMRHRSLAISAGHRR